MRASKATIAAVAGALAIGAFIVWRTLSGGPASNAHIVAVTVPQLSVRAERGQELFAANCAACHGENAGGTEQGPPLIHRVYEPNHHGDQAFLIAVTQGVRAHHWGFGSMPPVVGVSERQVADIVAYVRAVQKANGIF
ncbi:MAG: cytochrome c [Aurantimonas coralicida]|uniref:c-type cytochrome n=1 Tax=Aurantimonas coralicida TaxID=182270 RepID=UPI000C6A69EC|nr:cytochrome c [Aurantimonas coralicida]MAY28402.1 cytochrome C [Aurantimonas sp.]MCC4300335.1 cytochrome c [Aurantimonas coralicida]MCW7546215.1 cytochrome c [Aurantimonas litoralis]